VTHVDARIAATVHVVRGSLDKSVRDPAALVECEKRVLNQTNARSASSTGDWERQQARPPSAD